MTELVKHSSNSTALAIAGDQTEFSADQVAVLEQIGVKGASRADLAIYFHQAKRTGLDPFARQIYMIGRRQKEGGSLSRRFRPASMASDSSPGGRLTVPATSSVTRTRCTPRQTGPGTSYCRPA